MSSDESFAEIITSEEEVQFSSSDEEDEAQVLTMIEGVYCCNPALFSSDYADPVERHSLFLLDLIAMKVQVCHSCKIIRVENSIQKIRQGFMLVPCRKIPVYFTNCIWHGYAENALIFAKYARQVFYSSIETPVTVNR